MSEAKQALAIAAPESNDLLALSLLVKQMYEAELALALAMAEVEQKKSALAAIAEGQIPALMEQMGVKQFTTNTGIEVKVKQSISASIPEAQRQEAWDWLDANGHGGMIKRTVAVAFTANQDKAAKELQEKLRAEFPTVKEERKVEPATLSAWAKKRLEEGDAVPPCVAIFDKRVAQIDAKKMDKGPF